MKVSDPLCVPKDGYEISTDPVRLDLSLIHDFLSNRSYWAAGIPFEVMQRSFEHSLCFGVYHGADQVGFARVLTDHATTAYVGDVFIIEEHRGKGLAKWLVKTLVEHPSLQGLRLWFLGTKDAHGLYERYGFRRGAETSAMERLMAIFDPDVYGRREPDP